MLCCAGGRAYSLSAVVSTSQTDHDEGKTRKHGSSRHEYCAKIAPLTLKNNHPTEGSYLILFTREEKGEKNKKSCCSSLR